MKLNIGIGHKRGEVVKLNIGIGHKRGEVLKLNIPEREVVKRERWCCGSLMVEIRSGKNIHSKNEFCGGYGYLGKKKSAENLF